MNSFLITALIVVMVALLVVRQVVWERSMQRARENSTGIYRFSPPVRRVILVVLIVAVVGIDIATWH